MTRGRLVTPRQSLRPYSSLEITAGCSRTGESVRLGERREETRGRRGDGERNPRRKRRQEGKERDEKRKKESKKRNGHFYKPYISLKISKDAAEPESSLFYYTRDLSLKLLPTMQPDC